jgi:hypothetical protein
MDPSEEVDMMTKIVAPALLLSAVGISGNAACQELSSPVAAYGPELFGIFLDNRAYWDLMGAVQVTQSQRTTLEQRIADDARRIHEDLGAGWVRLQIRVDWLFGDDEAANCELSGQIRSERLAHLEQVADGLQGRGIRVMGTILGSRYGNRYYGPRGVAPECAPDPEGLQAEGRMPADIGLWVAEAREVVSGLGPHVDAWQIAEEPNVMYVDDFVVESADLPSWINHYAALVCATSGMIRETDPTASVVLGGIHLPVSAEGLVCSAQGGVGEVNIPTNFAGYTGRLLDTLQGCGLDAQGRRPIDVIGVNGYRVGVGPEHRAPYTPVDWDCREPSTCTYGRELDLIRDAAEARPYWRGLPMWITYLAHPGYQGGNSELGYVSEDEQADNLERFAALLSERPWVQRFFWTNLRDYCPIDFRNAPFGVFESMYGLMGCDDPPVASCEAPTGAEPTRIKPAYCRFAALRGLQPAGCPVLSPAP